MQYTFKDLEKLVASPDLAKRWGTDGIEIIRRVQSVISAPCSSCMYRRQIAAIQRILSRHGDTLSGTPAPTVPKHPDNSSAHRLVCPDCVVKHIAQAYVLQSEFYNGYTEYRPLIEAHLSEALEESPDNHPLKAYITRQLKELAVNGKPSIDLEVFQTCVIPTSSSTAELPVNTPAKPSEKALRSQLKALPSKVSQKVLIALRKLPDAWKSSTDHLQWEGYMACLSDLTALYSPELSALFRSRRLAALDDDILISCSDVLKLMESADAIQRTATGDTQQA